MARYEKFDETARNYMLRCVTIDELEDWRLRDVLEYRYIKLCTWESVAEAMSFSRQHVTRLHGTALVAIKPIIERRCACLLQ